jgi:hypothetical protein
MLNELNQEQQILFNRVKQNYSIAEWSHNAAIKVKEAIIHQETMSLEVIKREKIIIGPINIDINFKSVDKKIHQAHKINLSSYIYYDLNNITFFSIKIDILNKNYQINYASESLYEYGYEEDQIDKLEESTQHHDFKSILNLYNNIFNQLKAHLDDDKLIKKILKSINNYFNLKKDKKVLVGNGFVSSSSENEVNNNKALEYFIIKFEKEKLEASVMIDKEAFKKIKI